MDWVDEWLMGNSSGLGLCYGLGVGDCVSSSGTPLPAQTRLAIVQEHLCPRQGDLGVGLPHLGSFLAIFFADL